MGETSVATSCHVSVSVPYIPPSIPGKRSSRPCAWEICFCQQQTTCCLLADRELLASKDRLQLEVASHRSTTLELRTHIDVLSDALTTTRSTTKKYEEEVCPVKQLLYEHVYVCELTLSYFSNWRQNVPQEIPFFIRNQYSAIARMRSNTTAIIVRVKL